MDMNVVIIPMVIHPLMPQIHHTIGIGFAFNQAKGGFYGQRGKALKGL
jgi:hypothetical protein